MCDNGPTGSMPSAVSLLYGYYSTDHEETFQQMLKSPDEVGNNDVVPNSYVTLFGAAPTSGLKMQEVWANTLNPLGDISAEGMLQASLVSFMLGSTDQDIEPFVAYLEFNNAIDESGNIVWDNVYWTEQAVEYYDTAMSSAKYGGLLPNSIFPNEWCDEQQGANAQASVMRRIAVFIFNNSIDAANNTWWASTSTCNRAVYFNAANILIHGDNNRYQASTTSLYPHYPSDNLVANRWMNVQRYRLHELFHFMQDRSELHDNIGYLEDYSNDCPEYPSSDMHHTSSSVWSVGGTGGGHTLENCLMWPTYSQYSSEVPENERLFNDVCEICLKALRLGMDYYPNSDWYCCYCQ
jgi:hypothetical protein